MKAKIKGVELEVPQEEIKTFLNFLTTTEPKTIKEQINNLETESTTKIIKPIKEKYTYKKWTKKEVSKLKKDLLTIGLDLSKLGMEYQANYKSMENKFYYLRQEGKIPKRLGLIDGIIVDRRENQGRYKYRQQLKKNRKKKTYNISEEDRQERSKRMKNFWKRIRK